MDIVKKEEACLENIHWAIGRYAADRITTIAPHEA